MSKIGEGETTYEHESYGMIGISRISVVGDARIPMFGSSLERHPTLMRVTIYEGTRIHGLSRDRFHGGRIVAQVDLTATQFAEFVTTPNCGYGVPCTIRFRDGREMADPPAPPLEAEKVRADFAARTSELAGRMRAKRAEIAARMEKIPAKHRESVLKEIDLMIQEVESNMPFVLRQFEEAADRVVASSKAEVDAFMTHAIHSAGLAAIRANGLAVDQLADGTGREETER